MPDAVGTLEITLLYTTPSRDVSLKSKELYGRISLDGDDWRRTLARPTNSPTDTNSSLSGRQMSSSSIKKAGKSTSPRRKSSSPRRVISLNSSPVVLPLSDQHHILLELWSLRRDVDKEEVAGKGKINIRELGIVEEAELPENDNQAEVEVDVELHHHLHLLWGTARVLIRFVKTTPGPPNLATPHGASSPMETATDKGGKLIGILKDFKDKVRRSSKTEREKGERDRSSGELPV
ncbi:hypothetical protein BC832DRAFT_306663 [Gaertneriomyces semiglobifer]|nr:hypothetical protein BC832DRAFT_306663 [Gaertneriomyces semiglobifer]